MSWQKLIKKLGSNNEGSDSSATQGKTSVGWQSAGWQSANLSVVQEEELKGVIVGNK